jgi:hypothetical protein
MSYIVKYLIAFVLSIYLPVAAFAQGPFQRQAITVSSNLTINAGGSLVITGGTVNASNSTVAVSNLTQISRVTFRDGSTMTTAAIGTSGVFTVSGDANICAVTNGSGNASITISNDSSLAKLVGGDGSIFTNVLTGEQTSNNFLVASQPTSTWNTVTGKADTNGTYLNMHVGTANFAASGSSTNSVMLGSNGVNIVAAPGDTTGTTNIVYGIPYAGKGSVGVVVGPADYSAETNRVLREDGVWSEPIVGLTNGSDAALNSLSMSNQFAYIKDLSVSNSLTIEGGITVNGGIKFSVTTVTNSMTIGSLVQTDSVFRADTTLGAFTITLPASSITGKRIWIYKSGDTNALTVQRSGTHMINDVTTTTHSQAWTRIELQGINSTNWAQVVGYWRDLPPEDIGAALQAGVNGILIKSVGLDGTRSGTLGFQWYDGGPAAWTNYLYLDYNGQLRFGEPADDLGTNGDLIARAGNIGSMAVAISDTNYSASGVVTGINTIALFGSTGRLTNQVPYTTNLVSSSGGAATNAVSTVVSGTTTNNNVVTVILSTGLTQTLQAQTSTVTVTSSPRLVDTAGKNAILCSNLVDSLDAYNTVKAYLVPTNSTSFVGAMGDFIINNGGLVIARNSGGTLVQFESYLLAGYGNFMGLDFRQDYGAPYGFLGLDGRKNTALYNNTIPFRLAFNNGTIGNVFIYDTSQNAKATTVWQHYETRASPAFIIQGTNQLSSLGSVNANPAANQNYVQMRNLTAGKAAYFGVGSNYNLFAFGFATGTASNDATAHQEISTNSAVGFHNWGATPTNGIGLWLRDETNGLWVINVRTNGLFIGRTNNLTGNAIIATPLSE